MQPTTAEVQRDSKFLPTWHFAMLNDAARNDAIQRSIEAANPLGKTVYEIGTGTGVVALTFARLGAKKVFACEMNAYMYQLASKITAASEYAGVVEMIYGNSRETLPDIARSDPPDIIFSETLDCGVVGEGYANISIDVRALAGPETLIMPSRVTQYARMVACKAIDRLNRVDRALGFDVQMLNEHRTHTYYPVRSELYDLQFLSVKTRFQDFIYKTPLYAKTQSIEINRNGLCHGLLTWFEVDFGGYTVSSEPFSGSHWHQAFHPFDEPIAVRRGSRCHLTMSQTGAVENIEIEEQMSVATK